MMRILITGALGYLGGRISRHLSTRGDIFLRLGTNRRDVQQPQWLAQGEMAQLDVLSDDNLEASCAGINCIIHLAALNEIDSVVDPARALTVNAGGTLKLLQAARKAGVKRFIYFSTAHVYGAPLIGHITEQSIPRPVHPYAITHHTAEDFVLAEHEKKNIEGIVIRLSNSVGAPLDVSVNRWTLLVNDLCRQAVTQKQLILKTAGLQSRDFICLHDVCRIVEHMAKLSTESIGNGIFNVGGKRSLRVREIAEIIARRCEVTMGFRPSIHFPAAKISDGIAVHLDYDVEKLLSTGYVLTGDINKEIDETLAICLGSSAQ
ncbi:MAG: SDR family oxidoreductase [Elusimicrobia bacterium]|nr:SDR family oxidoreductase [Elusimicrobiota bacterium]